MTKPVILFRRCFDLNDVDLQEEFEIAGQYFNVVETRTEVPANSLVVGRYSVLPYYDELDKELKMKGGRLINTHCRASLCRRLVSICGASRGLYSQDLYNMGALARRHLDC